MDKIVCSEVNCILSQLDEWYYSLIPKEVIEFFEKNKDDKYECDISLDIPLEKQNLRNKTIEYISMINYEFLASEKEKKVLDEIYEENEKRIEKEQNVYEIFKNRQNEKINHKENKEMIVYKKDNLFTKIIDKLKKFFRFK